MSASTVNNKLLLPSRRLSNQSTDPTKVINSDESNYLVKHFSYESCLFGDYYIAIFVGLINTRS